MDVSCSSSKETVETPWCWSTLRREVTSWVNCSVAPEQFLNNSRSRDRFLTPLLQQDDHLQNEKHRQRQQPVKHVSYPNSSNNSINLKLKFKHAVFHCLGKAKKSFQADFVFWVFCSGTSRVSGVNKCQGVNPQQQASEALWE